MTTQERSRIVCPQCHADAELIQTATSLEAAGDGERTALANVIICNGIHD